MANPNTISGSPAPWRTCEQHPYAGLVFRTPAPNDHPQLATVIQKSFTAGIFAKTILAFQAEWSRYLKRHPLIWRIVRPASLIY